jgi:hypothetical protein
MEGDRPMSDLGDTITEGPIPADVLEIEDAGGDRVHRGASPEVWMCWPETNCIFHTENEILSYGPLTVTALGERPVSWSQSFHLAEDQLCALRELLGLVHYDTLANEWLRLLPKQFRPRRGVGDA